MRHAKTYGGFSRRALMLGGATAIATGWSRRAFAAPTGSVLVELFTSQGCNSCPPADAYLTELARQPGIVALAYHIDYWDQLGWRDPFSSPAATERQRSYARLLGLHTIYTPQMVIQGRHDVIGSDRGRVAAAITSSRTASPVGVALSADAGTLSVRIAAGSGEGRIWLAAYDLRHETRVRAGENAGRTLENVNIVRSIDVLGTWRGAELTFARPGPMPGTGVAVFVQAADGTILGVGAIAGS